MRAAWGLFAEVFRGAGPCNQNCCVSLPLFLTHGEVAVPPQVAGAK
jgi:hypothetical protein